MKLSSSISQVRNSALRPASVRVNRQLAAPPERIFDAWIDGETARRFLFGGRGGDALIEIDARLGGGFRMVRCRDGEQVEYSGEYLEIERPYRLVFSLFVEKYAQRDDRVIVEIAPLAQHSLLVLTHEMSLSNQAERSRIQREWALSLDALVALCAAVGAREAALRSVQPWTRALAGPGADF
jgi:uncharacterized protein YndB with AHSA1/START domain